VLKCPISERADAGHYLIKRLGPHEDLFLHIPDSNEEPWARERTLITKNGKRLALCTRQAVIGRRSVTKDRFVEFANVYGMYGTSRRNG
jgi:hypothetical protein